MHEYRLYNNVIPKKWIYNQTQMIVAEVNWDYSYEFDYPDEWDELHNLGYHDHTDAAVHLWLKKYHSDMYEWLNNRNINWRGTQSGDSEPTPNGIRGFTVVCVNLIESSHITEFMLTWG